MTAGRIFSRACLADDRCEDEGGILVMAVILVTAFIALGGLAFDGGRYVSEMIAATTEAQQAARLGASTLSQSQLQSGSLDPNTNAIAAADGLAAKSGHPGTASVRGGNVYVEVSYTVPTLFLGLFGIPELRIDARGSAADVTGL